MFNKEDRMSGGLPRIRFSFIRRPVSPHGVTTMTDRNEITIVEAGLQTYGDGLAMQAEAAGRVKGGESAGIIITIRHTPVVTLGHRGAESEVHLTATALKERGIDFFHVDRGGGATYHYPEQSVLYPILDLTRLRLPVPDLLTLSGAAVMECLDAIGVHGHWDETKPGVYMENGAKIASIGFHLSKGITTHGIAINTGAGWGGFQLIDPCKVRNQPITSVENETGVAPDPDRFGNGVALSIKRRIQERRA